MNRAKRIDVKPTQKLQTELQRLIEFFRESLTDLNVFVNERQLEEWSVVVHEGMSGCERDYHSIDHVFDVAAGASSAAKIGALFHDLVYVEIDGDLPPRQARLLVDIVEKKANGFALRPFNTTNDRNRAIVEAIFGVQIDSPLTPVSGLNEFLSAMLAIRSMADHLPTKLLVQIGVCIEATIPFRDIDSTRRSPAERLFGRLQQANSELRLGFTESELVATLHQAVDLANRDVAGFAIDDTGVFLDYTWRLLPESNLPLRYRSTYTLGEYRASLLKMARFLGNLKPELVFSRFRGIPKHSVYIDKSRQARINIERSVLYIDAKITALTILYSLALLTGGDAPVALFVGDLPQSSSQLGPRLEDFLNPIDTDNLCDGADQAVFNLLKYGRQHDSQFDIKRSPLAAYIYAELGNAGTGIAVQCITNEMDVAQAKEVLNKLPRHLRNEIVEACANIAINRAPLLLQLIKAN